MSRSQEECIHFITSKSNDGASDSTAMYADFIDSSEDIPRY